MAPEMREKKKQVVKEKTQEIPLPRKGPR